MIPHQEEKIPPELLRSIPRSACLTREGRVVAVSAVFLLVMGLGGLIVVAFAASLRAVPYWVIPVVPAAFALAAAMLRYLLRRQMRLLSEGRAALARVTHSKKFHEGDRHGYRVYYEFTILSGAVRQGRFEVSKNPPPDGSALAVVYETEPPHRSARYPFPLVRVG